MSEPLNREPIPTFFFVLVVVHDGGRYLLVQETRFDNGWYIPAGRVEPGESYLEAAQREALEESGIPVEVEGVIRIDHTPLPEGSSRVRVYLVARPRDDTPPKRAADMHSLGAAWFTLEEMRALPLRGEEAYRLCKYIDDGAHVYPLSILGVEGFE